MYSLTKVQNLVVLLTTLIMVAMIGVHQCDQTDDKSGGESPKAKLQVENLYKPENCARHAKMTDLLTLHYRGVIQATGEEFDSSYTHQQPFTFQLGIGQVIKGWDQGLIDVCAGEKLKLIVPPELAYGKNGIDKIPPHSTLEFELEIISIADGPSPVNVFKEIDVDADGKLTRKEVGDFLRKQLTLNGQGGGPDIDHDPESILNEVFSHEDQNGDGVITREEFSGPKHDHDEL